MRASGSRLVFTSDVTYRKGKDVPLKGLGPCVEHLVVLQRGSQPVPMQPGWDLTWDDFLVGSCGQNGSPVPLEANEPAFILATSGSTAKLSIHTHGGYPVPIHRMGDWCSGMRPDDVWWPTSEMGWMVGHSYIVYAPLLRGCTTIAYEGAIDHPDPGVLWRLVEEFGDTGLFTSSTASRENNSFPTI